jgi:hypothetical protein
VPTEVKGALELRKALRQFAPDLAKETRKEIAGILKPIAKEAKGFVPSNEEMISGWTVDKQKGAWERVAYDPSLVKRGIGYKTSPSKPNRQGFAALAQIRNRSAAGAIYETAGRKSSGGEFIPRFTPMTDSPQGKGRLIFKAWRNNNGKAVPAVLKAIETSADKLNKTASVI